MLQKVPVGELDATAAAEPSTRTLAPRVEARPVDGLAAGSPLDHFRIERKLGAGGMGEVYLATDLALDRPVAIKVLPANAATGAARERLVREARAQARIQHANVAHMYFIGEDGGRLYFAMELVAGVTLAEKVATGPMSVEDALATVRGAALGLREAQRSGFTHRDVKPSNLMVDAHGMVKVLDFGLVGAIPEHGDAVEQTSLAGTPLYMAPEQARGEPIDLRADIYALGATLFHLVSGRPPFEAETVGELITMHASGPRPAVPRGANPRTAVRAIDSLIARMMAPLPDDRFATYDDLLRAIELASTQQTRPAGFWVRSIATLVDLGIVGLATGGAMAPLHDNVDFLTMFPLLVLYLSFAISRWGTTAGKALFELEVVALDTATRPTFWRALQRTVVLYLGPCILAGVQRLTQFGFLSVIIVVAPMLFLFHAATHAPGKRAVWDRIAGTQVRYRATAQR
jgi:hypothetical protein